jgi:hypothetical protein
MLWPIAIVIPLFMPCHGSAVTDNVPCCLLSHYVVILWKRRWTTKIMHPSPFAHCMVDGKELNVSAIDPVLGNEMFNSAFPIFT